MILLNAFSANMLAEFPCSVTFTEITAAQARNRLVGLLDLASGSILPAPASGGEEVILNAVSAVGHADTAAVLGEVLGVPVDCNRITVTLKPGDDAIVGQYVGPRLPEGCKTLPDGATIKWLHVSVAPATAPE